ncbi:SxtJ family membrane protein [Thalassoglobus polymorphus]|uniref:SxtJ n=1 Tax=Thalassoglobus polymorphus TaxID=2527994 RepID=A0A517QR94_9PLAN|nr:SxtJ family membrane protein [Thalassoglobus polymorphus]QDT34128.1 hypothetical protein Mal48_33880 [Thalassoglobus polymorphus]
MQKFSESLQATESRLRAFACVQFLFFVVAAFVLGQWGISKEPLIVICVGSLVVACLGMIAPHVIRPIYRLWMLVVFPIGFLISHLLLAIVYYFVMTPIGLWRVRSTGDPLQRELTPDASTYWEKRKPTPAPETYFRQF